MPEPFIMSLHVKTRLSVFRKCGDAKIREWQGEMHFPANAEIDLIERLSEGPGYILTLKALVKMR